MELITIKIALAILAMVIGTGFSIPYFRSIFKGETQPHAYTWLIWFLSQIVATAGVWYGGGGITALGLLGGSLIALAVFLLSFKYGTKNIRPIDMVVLVIAIGAIVAWWQFHMPVLSVFIVTFIDFLGYFPTYRKSWGEPWSENLLTWVGYVIAPTLSFLALYEYNLLTTMYVVMSLFANLALVLLLLIRRQSVPAPTTLS